MRFVVALLFLVRLAHADVGVVVSGDPNMQARVLDLAQRWLQDHKHALVASPLGTASATLVDCFVIEDMSCATKVFAEHAKASTVVFLRADMVAAESRDYTLMAYWFTKGAEPVNSKRTCVQCDDKALDATLGTLLGELGRKSARGKGLIKIAGSGTAGMLVRIDGSEVGAPPVHHELPAGSHELVFVIDDSPVDIRRIDVSPGDVVELQAPHVPERASGGHARASRTVPVLLTVGGVAAAAAGGVLLYYGSLHGPDEPFIYTNATKIGLPLALVGAFAIGAGTSLWFARSGSDAQVGVSGTF